MFEQQEDVFYYITLMNENYPHPGLADARRAREEGILKGMYLLQDGGKTAKKGQRVQLMGSGTILREVIAAAELLKNDFNVTADIWSATSFNELRRDGMAHAALEPAASDGIAAPELARELPRRP